MLIVGGNATGGANVTAPQGGFSQKILGVLLAQHESVKTAETSTGSTPNNTTNPVAQSKHEAALSDASIAGIGVLLGLVLTLVFFVRRRQRSEHRDVTEMSGRCSNWRRASTTSLLIFGDSICP